jgi:DNA-binding CsgD family transcriptional regulator
LGLACWISSLLLYSETISPFQELGAPTFVGLFAEEALGLGVLAGVLAAVGGTGTALAWCRAYKCMSARRSLATVAVAGLFAALLGALMVGVPGVGKAVLLVACALVATLLPLALPSSDPAPDGLLAERPVGERLRSLTSVTAPALAGLLAFAYVMGTMRVLIVETYGVHLAVLVADALVLAAFALVRTWSPLVRTLYRNLIPVLAVCLLAVTNVTLSLRGGSAADMVMTYLLYTLAALVTLATLGAVAHAGEFSSDLLAAVAVALFCLASSVGLLVGGMLTAEQMRASTSVITTVYAFVVVLARGILTFKADRAEKGVPADGGEVPLDTGEAANSGSIGAPEAAAPSLEQRCAALAEERRLTSREAEILVYLANGHGSGYISEALYISPNTVRTHVHNLYRKLEVSSREEIIALMRG